MSRARASVGDEEGATAIIVAICMVVLMAAVALTVDVGGLMYRRRGMVNGADSAALAAAIACASGQNAETQADGHFLSNAAGTTTADVTGTNITELVGCGQLSGHVTVSYTSQQPLYFAPAIGLGDHRSVTTTATASWGPGGPFPISVNLGPPNAFHTCSINASPGDDCYYLFDNNANGNGDFGFLNLAQWSWPTDQGCSGAGGANLLKGEITETVPYSQYVFRVPDYVCQIGGLKANIWSQALASLAGQTRSFPINDPTRQTAKRWYIVGFAQIKVVDVNTNLNKNGRCGSLVAQNASNTCVHLQWISGGVGSGPSQLETIDLCDLAYDSCLDQATS